MLALNAEIILTDWQLDPIRQDVRRYPPIVIPTALTGAGMAIAAPLARASVSSIAPTRPSMASTNRAQWYEGAGFGDRRCLHADERGSIVAVTNDAGNAIAINRYDEFGIPAAGNIGRFQYTGQKWLPQIGLYDYKARMYSPTLGRFLQTDPIGYADGMNWYNYVGSDPINFSDPSGFVKKTEDDIVVCSSALWINGVCSSTSNFMRLLDDLLKSLSEPKFTISDPQPKGENPKRPKFCSNQVYQLADDLDNLFGKAQLAVLAGGVAGQGEPYRAARAAFRVGAGRLYGVLGTVRSVAAVAKFFAGDRDRTIADFAGDLVVKFSGIDKAGEAFAGVVGNFVKDRVRPDPCRQ